MKRRAFLGFLGGAAIAGPSAAKSAADLTLGDINLRTAGLALNAIPGGEVKGASSDQRSYAKQALSRLLGRSAAERARAKDQQYIEGLDPEIATLRSVALQSKVRMTRAAQFERNERRERTYFEGVIAGLWE